MAAESQARGIEEVIGIVADIKRLSDDGCSVTYGVLAQDEQVEQTYEALMGTLKAARKRGLLTFNGELLLVGQHDDTVITLTPETDQVASQETPAAAEPVAQAAPLEAEPAAPAEAEQPAAEETTSATEAAAPSAAEPDESEEQRGGSKNGAPSWKVDTSYINYRTEDPNRLEAKGSRTQGLEGVSQMPSVAPITAADKQKDEDGKWKKVDTGYIDHRTLDPNRFEVRKEAGDKSGDGYVPGTAVPMAQKDESGKWKSVDVSYIDHRTRDCDRLEPRRGAGPGVRASVGGSGAIPDSASATVKKEAEGKWTVDTSYIGHRTADTNNLERKLEKSDTPVYSSPAEKKYSAQELKLPTGERPADVDPSMKEQYLSPEEFQSIFKMSPDDFTKLPKWKQQNMKKAMDLW